MTPFIFAGAGAGAGLMIGIAIGAIIWGRRMRRRIEEIGGEAARLKSIAEQDFSDEDPDLKTLLKDLNAAVEQTYRAVDALENQSAINRRKSEAAKEVIASSRTIAYMMEDMGADIPDAAPTQIARDDDIIVAAVEKLSPTLR
ncbi:MAG: hypothetical protein AAGD92_08955 [Pseudomonadota bacterium]